MRRTATCTACGTDWTPETISGAVPAKCDSCDPLGAVRRAARRQAFENRQTRGPAFERIFDQVAEIAHALDPLDADRQALRRAITHVAHAEGPYVLRETLIHLAALAISWSTRLPASSKEAA